DVAVNVAVAVSVDVDVDVDVDVVVVVDVEAGRGPCRHRIGCKPAGHIGHVQGRRSAMTFGVRVQVHGDVHGQGYVHVFTCTGTLVALMQAVEERLRIVRVVVDARGLTPRGPPAPAAATTAAAAAAPATAAHHRCVHAVVDAL